MKILFIIKDVIAYERIGVMALSASLKRCGHETRLAVVSVGGLSAIEEVMRQFSPQIVGYSAMTGEHSALLEVNRTLKKNFNFLAVFGGPHSIFFPQVIKEDGVDAICVGEGDEAFPEFCRSLEEGGYYQNTLNFHLKYNGSIVKNPLRPLAADLNTLPLPDRKIIYDADPNMKNLRSKAFFASRGCPFECSYCFNKQFNQSYKGKGNVVRCISPERAIEEIEKVRDHYPLTQVSFCDSNFVLKPKGWLDEFCRRYKEKIALPFSIEIRPDLVRERDIIQLKRAGLSYVWMGVECGNEKVANEILQRNITNDQIIKAAEIFHRQGIRIVTFNIMGIPTPDAFKVDLETIDLNIKLRPTFASCGLIYPYPGTDIMEYGKKNGYLENPETFLESNKRTSIFTFSSSEEKRKIENLQKIAGIIVRFPILRPAAEFLSSLPLSGLYRVVFYLWLGYCMKVKIEPIRSIRKELPILARLFKQLLAKG